MCLSEELPLAVRRVSLLRESPPPTVLRIGPVTSVDFEESILLRFHQLVHALQQALLHLRPHRHLENNLAERHDRVHAAVGPSLHRGDSNSWDIAPHPLLHLPRLPPRPLQQDESHSRRSSRVMLLLEKALYGGSVVRWVDHTRFPLPCFKKLLQPMLVVGSPAYKQVSSNKGRAKVQQAACVGLSHELVNVAVQDNIDRHALRRIACHILKLAGAGADAPCCLKPAASTHLASYHCTLEGVLPLDLLPLSFPWIDSCHAAAFELPYSNGSMASSCSE
mmetsp:Transcript_13379/g.46659  ORF Transcript_13379/g.46659 Transcript_13379/m.46659 type:complete len:278 (-) Transcript_13379:232-1065(-)